MVSCSMCWLPAHTRQYFKEDPYEDMKHLDISSEDSLLVITSAGDNALHYAVAGKPKEVRTLIESLDSLANRLPDSLR